MDIENMNENSHYQKVSSKGNLKKSSSGSSVTARKPLADFGQSLQPERTVEEIYQKKTQLEHILLRPDTYVGSIEPISQPMYVFDKETGKIVNRKINYVPGLYKIFDEIIVNAADNKQRDPSMDTLKVDINVLEGSISVWNNGTGIPIVMHKEHHVYVPELIFGYLLTGSNFDDNQKKTTGGRNGYGAKLANIFSTKFVVETADKNAGKKYRQVFQNNMADKEKPVLSNWSKGDFTCITFTPDLARFHMDKLDDDIVSLFEKRIYDIAGITDKSLKVYLNGTKLSVQSFNEYVGMYQQPDKDSKILFDRVEDRWRVAVGLSDDSFQQVSFVNSICTTKGGQHVNYIIDQVVNRLIAVIKKKTKDVVKPAYIKNHMCVFVSALIDNPAFDSQTKETLTTRPGSFGSTYLLSEKFLKQIEKGGVVDQILSFAKFKQTAELRRKGGAKKTKITGIPKLDDANYAGSSRAHECTLVLTEGDSAKALAMSGLSVVGRDFFGVFPLKGKLLNVREASHAQIMKNEEIQNIVKILGIRFGQKYESNRSLRYGHLMIMADQDHDGSHIKGLVINFIHHFWPSLIQIDNFVQEFITPIVKATKGNRTEVFYTMPEFEKWKSEVANSHTWNTKYYKGLGTSTAKEAREYFSDLATHRIEFKYEDEEDSNAIDMAFSKKRVEERKTWLRGYNPGDHVDYDVEVMPYTEFVNKELILFSMADNIRSLPSVVDGFKPSQRKVLFSCFKRNLKNEIKVAQLAGYVSEHSAYHHGEMSLNGTIINMAQNFVGSNNINLLSPNGQFGTRLLGGKDAASPRYVFTKLELITRRLFNPLDDAALDFLKEDGQRIEPSWYVPVIPMSLVNGSEGIGTGWSCAIPNYNPRDIISNLRKKINNEEMSEMIPWYRGFKGQIIQKTGKDIGNFISQGIYEKVDETTVVITELPVKTWTTSYKQFLETMIESGTLKDFKEHHTDTTVHFTLSFSQDQMSEMEKTPGGIMKKLKLESSISTQNMHLFDCNHCIKKYETPLDIMEEFYAIRLSFYEKRKANILERLEEEKLRLSNRVRFILSVISGELVINNRKKNDLLNQLVTDCYALIVPPKNTSTSVDEGEETLDADDSNDLSRGYDYLLSMKIWSLTLEQVQKLKLELELKIKEFETILATTISEMWLTDLQELEELLEKMDEQVINDSASVGKKSKFSHSKKGPKKSSGKLSKFSFLDDDTTSDYNEKPRQSQSKHTKVQYKPKQPKSYIQDKPKSAKPGIKKVIEASIQDESSEEEFLPLNQRIGLLAKQKAESKYDDEEINHLAKTMAKTMEVTPRKQVPAAKTYTIGDSDSNSDDAAQKKLSQLRQGATTAGKKLSVSSQPKNQIKGGQKRPKEKTPQKPNIKKLTQNFAATLKSPYQISPDKKKRRQGHNKKDRLSQQKEATETQLSTLVPPSQRSKREVAKKIVYVASSDSENDVSSEFIAEGESDSDFD